MLDDSNKYRKSFYSIKIINLNRCTDSNKIVYGEAKATLVIKQSKYVTQLITKQGLTL